MVEMIIICAVLTLNIYLLTWDDTLRSHEHIDRAQHVLEKLKGEWPIQVGQCCKLRVKYVILFY